MEQRDSRTCVHLVYALSSCVHARMYVCSRSIAYRPRALTTIYPCVLALMSAAAYVLAPVHQGPICMSHICIKCRLPFIHALPSMPLLYYLSLYIIILSIGRSDQECQLRQHSAAWDIAW
jgi:hypothetical protein